MHEAKNQLRVVSDPIDLVMSLLRYYGVGARFNLRSQVFAKAAGVFDGVSDRVLSSSWLIYKRLLDFGLVEERGEPTGPSWQWSGDRITILGESRVFASSLLRRDKAFSELFQSGDFSRTVAYSIPRSAGVSGQLCYLEAPLNRALERYLQRSESMVVASRQDLGWSAIPSLEDVQYTVTDPIADVSRLECEYLDPMKRTWSYKVIDDADGCVAARTRRPHGAGFRYLIRLAGDGGWIEVRVVDWLELLVWWKSGTRWMIHYNKRQSRLHLPEAFFLGLPILVRSLIVRNSMVWPRIVRSEGRVFYEVADLGVEEFLSLRSRLGRVMEIQDEQ